MEDLGSDIDHAAIILTSTSATAPNPPIMFSQTFNATPEASLSSVRFLYFRPQELLRWEQPKNSRRRNRLFRHKSSETKGYRQKMAWG